MSEGAILALGEGLYELGLDGDTVREGFGGDAANTAAMAARMGAPARLLGRVGDDELGRRLLAFWGSCGLDVSEIIVDAERFTGVYVNRRGSDGARRFDYHRAGSAGSAVSVEDVARVRTEGVAFVHFTGIGLSVSETSAAACEALALRASGRVSFAANVRPRLAPDYDRLRAAAAAANVVFLSADDATLLYGSIEMAVASLSHVELVATVAERGATAYVAGDTIAISPPDVAVVDSAGAGDALAGAYLATRASGGSPRTALARGVAAGALSCRAFGCAASYATAAEVLAAT